MRDIIDIGLHRNPRGEDVTLYRGVNDETEFVMTFQIIYIHDFPVVEYIDPKYSDYYKRIKDQPAWHLTFDNLLELGYSLGLNKCRE